MVRLSAKLRVGQDAVGDLIENRYVDNVAGGTDSRCPGISMLLELYLVPSEHIVHDVRIADSYWMNADCQQIREDIKQVLQARAQQVTAGSILVLLQMNIDTPSGTSLWKIVTLFYYRLAHLALCGQFKMLL